MINVVIKNQVVKMITNVNMNWYVELRTIFVKQIVLLIYANYKRVYVWQMMNVKMTTFVELIIGVEVNYTFSVPLGLSLPIVFFRKMHHRKSLSCWWRWMYYFKRLYFGYNLYHRWNLQRYLRLFVLFCSELKLLFLIRDM